MLSNNDKVLKELEPDFAEKVNLVLKNCRASGIEIELRDGLRNTFAQAVYWKRSREQEEVANKIKELQGFNANFLAYCLFVVGEQRGPFTTNASPGLSWHQYGLAVDCAWIRDSKVCWDNEKLYDGINGYDVLADEARKQNIYCGHEWESFRDSGHLQASACSSPLEVFTWSEIDQMMCEKFLPLIAK